MHTWAELGQVAINLDEWLATVRLRLVRPLGPHTIPVAPSDVRLNGRSPARGGLTAGIRRAALFWGVGASSASAVLSLSRQHRPSATSGQ